MKNVSWLAIRCRLYVAYGFSVGLTLFRQNNWRKIRAGPGFDDISGRFRQVL